MCRQRTNTHASDEDVLWRCEFSHSVPRIQHDDEAGNDALPPTFDPIRCFSWLITVSAVSWLLWQEKERLLFSFLSKSIFCSAHWFGSLGAFPTRLRDYMPPVHRQQIETLSLSIRPSLSGFILSGSSANGCSLRSVGSQLLGPATRISAFLKKLRGVAVL